MKRYIFQALVTLDPRAAGDRVMPSAGQARRMAVGGRHHQTRRIKFFSAMVTSGQATLTRKDAHIVVTIIITGQDAPGYFGPGSPLALWLDGIIGHGTVTRRLFWPAAA